MNARENALREALQKNEDESQRWQTYLKENETAIENMSVFGKQLIIDVMVPVGKKAFMPGHLLHTNEVLVGHYQGYFSKCTTYKATEICELRKKMAKEHLKNLDIEAALLQNKLEKPYADGVIPSGEEREIIEEFDEETEKLWKERHRISVRLAKQKEREERTAIQEENSKAKHISENKTNEEILQMLEEAELMEELEQELNKLELDEDNDETIRKLMSGEVKLPQTKKRLAHDKKTQTKTSDETSILSNIVKKNDVKKITQINTNNNVQQNPIIMNFGNTAIEDVEKADDEILPEEVILIKEQAEFLNAEDQIGFYDYQIQIVRHKLQLLPLRTQQELDEKIHLLNVIEHLEELLEGAEEIVGAAEVFNKDEAVQSNKHVEKGFIEKDILNSKKEIISEVITTNEPHNGKKCNKKCRISFDLEAKTLEFKKHEAVTQMLPAKMEIPQRDKIKLEGDSGLEEKCKFKVENSFHKKDIIQGKVQKNLEFVAENQSKQNFDLIHQILQSSMGDINTLHINLTHSQQEGYQICSTKSLNIPGNPADIYNLHVKSLQSFEHVNAPSTLYINGYEGEDQVKVPALKEADRKLLFENPKSEFSNPFQAKSILKNKSAVEKEKHYDDSQKGSNNKKFKKDDDCTSVYYKVMNDVVEKHLTEPEPLPEVNFIDAHTPKKRVSRFKQMRHGKEKT